MVFIDTGYLLAITNTRDENHPAARECRERAVDNGWQLLTTEFCLIEVFDYYSHPNSRSLAVSIWETVHSRSDVTVVSLSRSLLIAGIRRYRDRRDQDWELTDCISFVTMDRHGVTRAFTFDDDFEQAGYIVVVP